MIPSTKPPADDAGDLGSAAQLRERIKELTCLYEVAAAFVEHRGSMRDCFQHIITIVPRALRYPEHAAACIRLDDLEVGTSDTGSAAAASRSMASDIRIGGRTRGSIAVHYRDAAPRTPPASEFLPEEHSLLETVARQIGIFVERIEAEEHRARAEQQLRHADRLAAIGQLAAGVAHELNEPLGNILGFAQLAQSSGQLPEQTRRDVDRIVEATLHGREIIRKLLVFARQAPAAKSPVDINTIVEDAMFLLEAGCENPAITFQRQLDPSLPPIEADPVQIRQILVNLVINAMHAVERGGRITVRTHRAEQDVVLSVEDTGHGMIPEVAERIFDPFFTTKDVGQGTGLGLSVVQGIVNAHGGTIRLTTAPGQGSRFDVHLPIAPHAAH